MSPLVPAALADHRHAGAAALARSLTDARAQLLVLFDAYRAAVPKLEIRYAAELNPPLWELGHIAWFEEWWLERNPQRLRGAAADPDTARAAPLIAGADALYNSSRVAHTSRWHLDLPDAKRTLRYAAQVRERTLGLLDRAGPTDDDLYFFRLALAHEDMHREAWAYMAQTLAIDVADALPVAAPAPQPQQGELEVGAQAFALGSAGGGFAFDNELAANEVALPRFAIDRGVVTWRRFLPFVEEGGYTERRWWSDEGWRWRKRAALERPRALMRDGERWQRTRFGRWVDLDPDEPAIHLTRHEALAWCAWAGRRLPSEAEWECAAATAGDAFAWGQVWEWTSSVFAPYAGFAPHPYRDYSMPWFDGRPVLRGASFATAPRMKHPRYRNYFPAERNDIFAGFRSCAR
jgi:ergothioneine biosynthesis protein EgtB